MIGTLVVCVKYIMEKKDRKKKDIIVFIDDLAKCLENRSITSRILSSVNLSTNALHLFFSWSYPSNSFTLIFRRIQKIIKNKKSL